MDIQSSKIALAKLILNLESPSIVNKIIALIKSGQSDFWMELSDEDKAEINLGIEQLDAGQRTSFDDFIKKVS
jgi:hypothetical protein